MKKANVASAAILGLLLAAAAVAHAQRDQQDPDKSKPSHQSQQARPVQQSHPSQSARPAQTQSRPPQTYGGTYHGGVQYNGPTNGGVHPSGVPQHQGQVRSGFVQSRAGSWNNEHQNWTQRGGYNGYRIPDVRFRLYFGQVTFSGSVGFPLFLSEVMPRFQYDGYWVTFMDPWPEGWAPDWYESDDVYLDYNGDGYYVYDQLHPDMPIAVTITF